MAHVLEDILKKLAPAYVNYNNIDIKKNLISNVDHNQVNERLQLKIIYTNTVIGIYDF